MDIIKLKAFVAICSTGSYTKVAKEFGYTHAGISYMIKSLEDEIGFSLLEKKGNSRVPTANARRILPEIREVLDAMDRLDRAIAVSRSNMGVGLSIGAIESASSKWVPLAVSRFNQSYPEISVNVFTGDPFQINEWIRTNSVDLGITVQDWSDSDYEWSPLIHDRFYGLFPRNYPKDDFATLQDFEGQYVFIPNSYGNRSITALLDQYHITYNAPEDNTISSQLVNANVAVGRGLSIATALMLDTVTSTSSITELQPKILPIEPPEYREIGVARKKEEARSRAADAFLKCLRQVMLEYPIRIPGNNEENAGGETV